MTITDDPARRPDWMADAECANTSPALFYFDAGDQGTVKGAKAICARCPVRDECLAHALANDERFGVWGGTTVRERQRLRRTMPRLVSAYIHGTNNGYQRHYRDGTPPCDACRRAHTAYQLSGRERTKDDVA